MSNNADEATQLTPSPEKRRLSSPHMTVRTHNLRVPKDRKDDYKQHFQRFVMTVYQTVRRQRSRNPDDDPLRTVYLEIPEASFPKLPNRGSTPNELDIEAEIEQALIASTKGFPNPKYKMLKNFLNNYQEIKKKSQVEGMSMLGLEVRKLDCNNGSLSKRRNSARKAAPQPLPRDLLDIRQSVMMPKTERKTTTLLECRGYSTRREHPNTVNVSRKIREEQLQQPVAIELNEEEQQLLISKVDLTERSDREHSERAKLNSLATNVPPKYAYYHEKVLKGKFKFGQPETASTIYEGKMQSYREFLFRVHLAHNVFIELTKRDDDPTYQLRNDAKYRAWIGPGNNSLLVKGLIKRRFWWLLVEDRTPETNFVWTQIKLNQVFKRQPRSRTQQSLPSVEPEEEEEETQQKKVSLRATRKRKIEPKEDGLGKLLTLSDQKLVRQYIQKYENKAPTKLQHKREHLGKPLLEMPLEDPKTLCHNHIQNNFFLGNKKAMFHNLKQYYELTEESVFENLPLTFHIRNGLKCAQYKRFLHYHKKRATHIKRQEKAAEEGNAPRKPLRNIWIVKPGQLSNRGNGITVIDEVYELNKILNKKEQHGNGTAKTYIVQLYLDRPLLYNRRKFDLRHYMLITNLFGVTRGYWYSEGYVRTSSYEFDIFNFEREIHLTNDAVQKHTALYGRYEPGNKLSYAQLQRYLDATYPNKHYSLAGQVLPKMRQIGRDAVRSAYLKLSPNNLEHNFEILGLDFMIDENFKPWLIEINTNPCLELSCPLLGRIIPLMVEQSLRLSLDVVFPPPCHYSNTTKHLVPDMSMEYLKYELIFDSLAEGEELRTLYRNVKLSKLMDEIGEVSDDEQYADEGQQIKLEDIS